MIVVAVNGLASNTMYSDTHDGQYPLETVIITDLIPHIDATYRTIAAREARGVNGFSMGGFGAAHLGFKYPDVFGVDSIMAPPLSRVSAACPRRRGAGYSRPPWTATWSTGRVTTPLSSP
jgi:S-formylglutathione hydrolase FrmB